MALIDGLTAYYNFDTDENPVQDQHGSYDMTVSGAIFDNGDGIINSSFLWDDAADRVYNGTLLDTTPAAISVSFWFKHSDTFDSTKVTSEYLITKDNVVNEDNFRVYLNEADGALTWDTEEHNHGSKTLASTTTSWTAGTWYYIVLTWDTSNGKRIYVNGSLESSDGTAAALMGNGTGTDFVIGNARAGYNNGCNDANIDEFGVWSKLLDQADVTALYNGGSGLAYPFSTGTNCQVNIGDSWKAISAAQINIGDSWKAVEGMQINIGDSWKVIF